MNELKNVIILHLKFKTAIFVENLVLMKRFIIQIVLFILIFPVFSQESNQAVPYTLADRDRLIKVETKIEGLEKRVDLLDQNINDRIDRLEDKFDTYFTWGFGLVLGAIFALFGFILYDRRTTLAPVKREQDKVIETLRELGKHDTKIREALKKAALW